MIKDQLYYNRRQEEQGKILKTSFWEDYISRIEKFRQGALEQCTTSKDIDFLRQAQGAVRIINIILQIPDEMAREKMATPSEEENA